MRKSRPTILMLALICASAACRPSITIDSTRVAARCLDRVTNDAFATSALHDIAATYAGPLGLVNSSSPESPPFRTHQVGFPAPDGSTHHFAVDTPQWRKALFFRIAPDPDGPTTTFLSWTGVAICYPPLFLGTARSGSWIPTTDQFDQTSIQSSECGLSLRARSAAPEAECRLRVEQRTYHPLLPM